VSYERNDVSLWTQVLKNEVRLEESEKAHAATKRQLRLLRAEAAKEKEAADSKCSSTSSEAAESEVAGPADRLRAPGKPSLMPIPLQAYQLLSYLHQVLGASQGPVMEASGRCREHPSVCSLNAVRSTFLLRYPHKCVQCWTQTSNLRTCLDSRDRHVIYH